MVAVNIMADKSGTSDLHESFRYLMQVCRWLGFFPVNGLSSNSIGEIKFNMKSIFGIYHGFTIFTTFAITMVTFYVLLTFGFSLGTLTTILLVGAVFTNVMIYNMLARKWSYLMKKSINFEKDLVKMRTSTTVSRNCKVISGSFLVLGLTERLVYFIFTLDFARRCMGESSITHLVVKNAVITKSPTIFNFLDYNIFTAIVSEMLSLQSVFVMNFNDIMLMLISYYLSSYFRDLNQLIESQKNDKSADWGQIRRYYSTIVLMVKLYERYFCFSVLLSMSSNLFFICLQLYNIFNLSKDGFEYCKNDETIYEAFSAPLYYLFYGYSFMTLVIRTFSMAFLTANVHSASQEPLFAIGEVHSSVYGIEIERFIRQITYTDIGIGSIFFNVTRQLILKVFATMITYELVMVQFAQTATELNPVIIPDNSSLSFNDTSSFLNDTTENLIS